MERVRELLIQVRRLVDKQIERYIPRSGSPRDFYAPVWDLLGRGGKRFRPALTILSCQAVGGRFEAAIPAATAVELLHNMTLIHDDIEDGSELRRGKPCIHIIYGVPKAINVGDAMLIKVFEAASSGDMPEDVRLRLVQQVARRAYQITWGQAYELYAKTIRNFNERHVIRILRNKTGALTALATEAGAIVGGASRREYNALSKFGEAIGIGFQIIDDVLNVSGAVSKYGKEIGGDIREGKRTIMAAHVLRKAPPYERRRFLRILGKPDISPREISEAIEMYMSYRSIDYARRRARMFIDSGVKALGQLRRSEARDALASVANFLVEREF